MKILQVQCDIDNLKKIRDFVSDSLREIHVSNEDRNLIVLAIDEVCSNLIIHSNNENIDESLTIRVIQNQEPDGVTFEIEDSGAAFDYSAYQEPSLNDIIEEKRKGGMGMMLVRRIMDSIEFNSGKVSNTCKLFKKLSFVNS